MKRLQKLANLSWRERWILVQASFYLLVVECALRAFPFQSLIARLQGTERARRMTSSQRLSTERIAWLVEVAARYSPLRGPLRPTCLRKSLVLLVLLRRDGAARLVIGARSPHHSPQHLPQQGFGAHAWVELDGEVVGSQIPAGYYELKAFETLAVARPIA